MPLITDDDKIDKIDIKYAAGFIDADGCISSWRNKAGYLYWELNAVQSEKNSLLPLQQMQSRWGGSLSHTKSKTKYKPMWKWAVKGIEAAVAIQDIYFYLITKKDIATDALEYYSHHKKYGNIIKRIGEPRP